MVEMEHTEDEAEAEKIAMDHLREDPEYYDKLEGMEEGETPEQEEEENEEEEGEDEEEKGSEKPMFSLSELVRKKGGEEEPALKIEIKKKGKMR